LGLWENKDGFDGGKEREKSDKRLKRSGNKFKKLERVEWFCLRKTRGELGRKKVRKEVGEEVENWVEILGNFIMIFGF
jgi:hypothetical protein